MQVDPQDSNLAQIHGRRRLAEGEKNFFAAIDRAHRADPGHTLLTFGSSLVPTTPHAHGHDARAPTAHGINGYRLVGTH